jgi:hypothetical protein
MKELINHFKSFFMTPKIESITFEDKFISLAINKNLTHEKTVSRVIQLKDLEDNIYHHALYLKSNNSLIETFYNNRPLAPSTKSDESARDEYIDKVAEVFHISLEQAKNHLAAPSEVASDLSSENKGLEWIKATLIVLSFPGDSVRFISQRLCPIVGDQTH